MFSPIVPTSVLTASRDERSAVPLTLVRDQLPRKLNDHYFLIAPIGTLSSNDRRPYAPQTTVMNNDDLVARVDFANNTATMTSRILKTPDYVADEITQTVP